MPRRITTALRRWLNGNPISTPEPSGETDDRPYVLATLAGTLGLLAGQLGAMGLSRLFPELTQSPLAGIVLGLLPFHVGACTAALLFLRHECPRRSLRDALGLPAPGEHPRPQLARALRQLLVLYPGMLLLNAMSVLLFRLLSWPLPEQAIMQYARQDCGQLFWIVAALSAVLIAPVCEEVFFRELLFRGARYLSPRQPAFWTALAFSLFHGLPQYGPSLVVLGLALQQARAQGGLAQAILLHSIYNLLTLLTLVLYSAWQAAG